jgi:hypothetical protein
VGVAAEFEVELPYPCIRHEVRYQPVNGGSLAGVVVVSGKSRVSGGAGELLVVGIESVIVGTPVGVPPPVFPSLPPPLPLPPPPMQICPMEQQPPSTQYWLALQQFPS